MESRQAPDTGRLVAAVALCVIHTALAVYLNVLGTFFLFFLPLPVLYARARFGRRHGALVTAATVFAGML
ncbi:MAG: DUF2232 domain-containing protein, partial [Desulfatibacillaceae bacterium]